MFMTTVAVAYHLLLILPKSVWDTNHSKGIDRVPDLGIRLCSFQSVAIIWLSWPSLFQYCVFSIMIQHKSLIIIIVFNDKSSWTVKKKKGVSQAFVICILLSYCNLLIALYLCILWHTVVFLHAVCYNPLFLWTVICAWYFDIFYICILKQWNLCVVVVTFTSKIL
jgi:hypothetical protein